jgi:hypothetical protein
MVFKEKMAALSRNEHLCVKTSREWQHNWIHVLLQLVKILKELIMY